MQRTHGCAADRVILDRQALAPLSAAACARGPSSWRRNRSPVTVPRASGENPGQDDPDAAGVLDLDSGPEMGTSPGSSNGPEPGRRPCPGTPWRSRPPRPRPPGRRRIRLPGASILYLGITLSDERGEGERAHCRRSVLERSSQRPPLETRRRGRSEFCPQRPAQMADSVTGPWNHSLGTIAVWPMTRNLPAVSGT